MSRVWFINRVYAPSPQATAQLLTDLAPGLAATGRRIHVITTAAPPAALGSAPLDGVNIHRVAHAAHPASLLQRLRAARRFRTATARLLERELRAEDVVVALTDPPLIGLTAARACRRSSARLIHWVQDIYPEVVPAVGLRGWGDVLVALTRRARNRAWREASHCVTPSAEMAATLQAAGVPATGLRVSANWAPVVPPPTPAALAAVRAAWGLNDELAVIYSGNLGRVHDLLPCLDVAAALAEDPRFAFRFVGTGAQHASLAAAARRRGLPNVAFHPPVPRSDLGAALNAADVHWVTLREGCEGLVYPSKLYGIAAAARPVLGIAARSAQLTRDINDHDFGLCRPRTHLADLIAQLRHWHDEPATRTAAGAAALRFATATGGPERALREWQVLLAP